MEVILFSARAKAATICRNLYILTHIPVSLSSTETAKCVVFSKVWFWHGFHETVQYCMK